MQFTADASHELRGPLMAIKASIGVMQRHPERFTPKDIKKLDAIGSATTQLQSLAEDLLLLARMDAEQTTQSPEKVSINRCLRDVVALYGEAAIAKGLELSLLEHEQGFVWGQAGQLNRLFANLVQNALHYTQTGHIIVSVARTRRYIRIQVEDSGIGIAPEDLPRVFDRFWRADKARNRRAGGSGLGLAIAQAITHQHGGKNLGDQPSGAGQLFPCGAPPGGCGTPAQDCQSHLGSPILNLVTIQMESFWQKTTVFHSGLGWTAFFHPCQGEKGDRISVNLTKRIPFLLGSREAWGQESTARVHCNWSVGDGREKFLEVLSVVSCWGRPWAP